MRFSSERVDQFARWSADQNPLHTDAAFARHTHFGRPIVHGVLTVLEALRDAAPLSDVAALDVEFRHAAVVDHDYSTEVERDGGNVQIVVRSGAQSILTVRTQASPAAEAPSFERWPTVSSAPRNAPAARALEEFERGVVVGGAYPLRVPQDGAAAAAGLTHTQARVLALCSYITGMELPGLRSLFTRISVTFHACADTADELHYRARTTRFDRHFRLLDTELDVVNASGALIAHALLRSYVPFSPAAPQIGLLAAMLGPTADLTAKAALVIGASRGLGAEIAAALALGGCHVYATARSAPYAGFDVNDAWAADLRARGASIEFVQGDAADPAWCESMTADILARHGRLDLAVLNACEPPGMLRLGADSAARHAQYVRDNLRLVEVPLAMFAGALEQSGGSAVCVSSSYVTETPAGFAHYVAVKLGAEALVQTLCRERPAISGLIIRPPVLQTRWNDTPAAAVGAIGPDRVAIHTIRALATRTRDDAGVQVLSEFPEIDRAATEVRDARPSLTIRVAATFTTDPLIPALRFWAKELGFGTSIEPTPYGQVLQSMLDPGSALNASGSGVNVVLVRVRDWLRELGDEQAGDIEFVRTFLHDTVSEFARALQAHRAQARCSTLLLICPSYGALSSAENILLRQAEADIVRAAHDIAGVDVTLVSDYHPYYEVNEDEAHDELRDDLAHIPYRDEYLCVLATVAARRIYSQVTPARKVVVVDCDNTLWRGVVGEVGVEGLEIDAGHRRLHETLVRLAESGVLVCLCSKNEEADVWRVFDTRDDLRLGRQHVVAAMINWLAKSQNLQTLATRLNLGLDSFVFIDDNPVECAEVRTGCPGVLTIQWPQTSADAERLLHHIWEFDPRKATKEDAQRTDLYKQEFRRQHARAQTLTFEDFINSLQLQVEFARLGPEDLRRAAQLTLRTNQFNFTTRRRDEAEMQALVAADRHEIRTVRVRDRFGDYGLVGLVIAERGSDTWTLDTFLLSCRVLGRGVEHRILADIGDMASRAGARTVKVRVEKTKRNTPARAFVDAAIPAEYGQADDRGATYEVPVDVLAATRFEPANASTPAVADESEAPAAHQAVDAQSLRRREMQITRSAFELASGPALRAAIDGRPALAEPPATGIDIAATVHDVFARALRVPVERVAAIDTLEGLGCDSLRIVEITVALAEKFPQLPSTLLFEHRSVSNIITEISQLADRARSGGVAASAPAAVVLESPRVDGTATDIAVVGLHVRCAGANSAEDLWRLLSTGDTAVKPVPPDREHFLQPLSDSRPHWAGLLERPSQFDAEFFGVSPREAEFMDPQLRLFLEVAWGALEDAGVAGAAHDPATGVFVGVMYGDYAFRANLAGGSNPYRCWEGFSLANRLSQLLGFHGPSIAVDTACSSSGTAVHLACNALRAGECNLAVVGGVNLILDPDRFASLGRLGILSMRGSCEPFGADADGTVLGEGAGVVVLRPLDEARQRGDRIYGVIKGTGLSTGSGTVGFTAPNPQSQAEAIRRALKAARVDPRTISYIETHGTGTALGDPIEVRGLTLAYADTELQHSAVELTHRATIGSIKPNIGHLEAGAGVLGLIKVLLQLQRGMLLPSRTSAAANPQIAFAEGPFSVQRALAEWPRVRMRVNGATTEVPRRAALSSFGVGGANAHIIVEEAPAHPAAGQAAVDRGAHVLALSARTAASLREQAAALRDYVEQTDAALQDICYSVNTGRKHFATRAAVVARTRDELLKSLKSLAEHGERPATSRGTRPPAVAHKVAFLFTGQGSQYAGMGRPLYATQPVFRRALDRCAAIFDTLLNRPLLSLLFADEGSAEAELLNQTGYTQPALFAFEYALSELWQSWGVHPDVVLGHSVGEISAMCVAGGISLEDGLKLIAARGRLMQALPAGGMMTSVMADESRVLRAIAGSEDVVAIAAINAPGQVVISGAGTAVAEIEARLTAEGIKTKALTVSHAFHSPLMRPMLAEYEQVVRQIKFSRPRVPMVNCVDGVMAGEEITHTEYWLRNVTEPVRFAAGVRALEAQHVTTYLEVGPHPVLLGMARQCVSDDGPVTWVPSLRKDADGWQTILGSVATLYTHGTEIDWPAFDQPYVRQRVSVPAYVFAPKNYWLRNTVALSAPVATPEESDSAAPATSGVGAYEVVWRKSDAPRDAAANDNRHWLVVGDYAGVGASLVQTLVARGRSATLVTGDEIDLAGRWRELARNDAAAPGIVYLRGLDALPAAALTAAALSADVERGLSGALQVVHAATGGSMANAKVWFVTRNAVATGAATGNPVAVSAAPLWGFARTFALEHPEHYGGLIDLSLDGPGAVASLASELLGGDDEDQVALTPEGRLVPRIAAAVHVDGRANALSSDRTHLVTGGVGVLGLHSARWLVNRGARRLVLAARRSALSTDAQRTVEQLRAQGASVTVISADVSRPGDVDRLLHEASAGAPLGGIVHAAGIDRPVALSAMTMSDVRPVLAGKVMGAWLLHERTRHLALDLFVCFSSMSALLGAHARAHYAAANAFLDALMAERRRAGLRGLSVNWGPWSGGGIASSDDLAQFARIGNHALRPEAALLQLDTTLASGAAHALVADVDWPTFRSVYEARRRRLVLSELGAPIAPTGSGPSPGGAPWIDELRSLPLDGRVERMTELLRHEVADTLGFDSDDSVPLDSSFYELGMDSLMMADLLGRLKQRLGMSCTAMVFNHPNVRALAPLVLEQAPLDGPGRAAIPAPAQTNPVNPVTAPAFTEREIVAFQRRAYPHRDLELIPKRWRWMFVDSAQRLGAPLRFWVHRDGGAIVGHMGSIAVRVKVADQVLDTGWLVDTMVLKEHRTRAVGSRLMVEAHDDQPFSLSLGQTAEMREIQFRLGWKQVAPLNIAQLIVRASNVLKGKVPPPLAWAADVGLRAAGAWRDRLGEVGTLQAVEIARFDEQHDALWAKASEHLVCAVVRDASYLNWKYVDQPGQTFLRLNVLAESDLVAAAVWMFREADGNYKYRRALLVDLMAPFGDEEMLQRVVRAASAAAVSRGADALLCHHVNPSLSRALRHSGFHFRKPERYFLIDPGGLPGSARDAVLAADNWLITHGDSDIDRPW